MTPLRLLFWLKWKLLLRGFRGNTTALVGVILAILFFLPAALGIAFGCLVGFTTLQPPWPMHLLRGVLLGIYVLWLLGPLMGYALNDSYDITKLFLYPISLRQIFTGAILGSFVDFPVLLLLPTLLVVILAFSSSLLALIVTVAAVGLFLFHTLALSQALILATAGILRSRRFRDLAIIAIPVFWMGYYILSQSLSKRLVQVNVKVFLEHSPTWELVNYLPSGLAARSVTAACDGEAGSALLFLALLLAVCAATVYLAGWLVQLAFEGVVISPALRKRARPAPLPPPVTPTRLRRVPARRPVTHSWVRLPPVVEAMVDKEMKYIARDPYFKLALVNVFYMLVVAVFAFVGGRSSSSMDFRPAMVWGMTGMVLVSEMSLLFNIFGTEGGAATVLFLFPSSRRQILMGKNLTFFTALSLVNLVMMVIMAALGGAFEIFGILFCWMELSLVVFLAVGNLASIWFPTRMVMRGRRLTSSQQTATRGCAYGILYLPLMGATFTLLLPVLAALIVPTFGWVSPLWHAVGIPVATFYTLGLYLLSLRLAEPLLCQRELVIIERVAQED